MNRHPVFLSLLGAAATVCACACAAGCGAELGDPTTDGDGESDQPGDGGGGGGKGDSPTDLPPLGDFALGPYPSAHDLLLASLEHFADRFDPRARYDDVLGSAYVVQVAARFLAAARGAELPGGEPERRRLVELALAEVDELAAVADQVIQSPPGWGTRNAFDAFQDGSVNPPFTNYAWQTGMIARGLMDLAEVLDGEADRLPDLAARRGELVALARAIFSQWHAAGYVPLADAGHPSWGYYRYSLAPADAKPVWNTAALLASAETMLAELTGDPIFGERPAASFAFFREGGAAHGALTYQPEADAYVWKYGDLGASSAEDISHGAVTLMWARFAFDRGDLTARDAARFQNTIAELIYRGNPARLAGTVDGSDAGYDPWRLSDAASIGMAVWGDALDFDQGGRVEIWELGRSVLTSSHLTRNDVPITAPVTGNIYSALTIAHLFGHRPPELAPDSRWVMVAGDPADQAVPTSASGGGGVRFYTEDWSPPAQLEVASLPGQSGVTIRRATAADANLLVDLPADGAKYGAVVSLTYRSGTDGSVQQWDGTGYRTLAPLPATRVPGRDEPVLFRTSFRLDQAVRFDYQPAVPGDNVLLQLDTDAVEVHRIEATPL